MLRSSAVPVVLLLITACSNETLVGLSTTEKQVAQPLDFCTKLPALAGTPVIDGAPDSSLPTRELPRSTWREPKNPMPDTLSAQYLVGWAPEGVYFYVQVQAPVVRPSPLPDAPWCGDAVHLFVDSDGAYANPPAYDKPGTRQFIIPAPDGATANTTRAVSTDGGALTDFATGRFGAFLRDGGYAVEALITSADLGAVLQATSGRSVGFSLSVSFSGRRAVPNPNDAACEGLRLGDIALALGDGTCTSPHCNVNAFCSPTLVE